VQHLLSSILTHGTIEHLLRDYGYWFVALIVGLESLGVPLPGETTLNLAAIYAGATGRLSLWAVVLAAAAGAIIGDNLGYALGRFGGYRLLSRYGHYVRLDKRRLLVGRYVFAHHGGKVVFFGRFVSLLRIYAAFLAGVSRMRWWRFLLYNALGGIAWAALFGVSSYYFGSLIERLGVYFGAGLVLLVLAGVVAAFLYLRRQEAGLTDKALAEFGDELEATPAQSTG
jgi:membrane protein DedA with SNARE-associated domain